jgi:hypothetical protein
MFWSQGLTGTSWGALLAWIVPLASLHIIGLPLAKAVFRRFPDQGWGFARLLALLTAAYGVWLLASVRLLSFHPAVILTSLVRTFCAGFAITHALHGSHRVPLPDEGK